MSDTDQTSAIERHRSPGLVLFGLLALGVAVWGIADGPTFPDASNLGWLAVGVGLVVGLLLIVTGARSQR
ncbi:MULTISPECIES: hypothetical protein [unclassified Gordonia (in: high G+C Gram-positive bacteria)]|uniref:hypothetical protein n=1 Tax=unclassified Gordonia (in: high G+C Gram-positive bacteria) TaxID=2657482 RepID=UPI001F0F2061|nr:hypothetical protein [Gordonia sp. ABSL49_1]MCH5642180.1 hypothetical protein [Gordonia sp. ABSL49_1]